MRFLQKNKTFFLSLCAIVFLGAGCIRIRTGSGDAGIFYSSDGGGTWSQKIFVEQIKKRTVTIGGESIIALVADPKNPLTLYALSEDNGLYISKDSGDDWDHLLPFSGKARAFALHSKDSKTFFIALGERVLRSTDHGATLTVSYIESRQKVEIRSLVIDAFDPKKIYIALSNGDLMHSTDNGTSWSLLYHTNSPILQFLAHPKDTRVLTIMTQYDGIFRSTNLGKDWQSLRTSLEPWSDSARGQAIATDSKNAAQLFYFSNYGLLETVDGGATWHPLGLLASPRDAPVKTFAVAPSTSDVLYYTTTTTLYRSRDHGKTWSTTTLPTQKFPATILIDAKNDKKLYLGIRNAR